jgi:N-acetylglucosaminyldiphosphoundecaprenol N-acetyl-beta-D-mannosaminyltransferase
MSEIRLWADDPVTEFSTVIEIPELVPSDRQRTGQLKAPVATKIDPPVTILGVPFDAVTIGDALLRIEGMIASRRPHYIVTANVDFVVQAHEDIELHRILLEADLVLCDGQPLVWISRWVGKPLPERVAGSDLVPELIRLAANKGYRIFFLGGTPHVAAQAAANIQAMHPGVKVCGHYSPEFSPLLDMQHDEIADRIRRARPDLLFVSLGCPKAEKWMAMHYRKLGVPVAIGVGATIDFLAHRMKRAPRWMQRSGTEWLFRLWQEPRRLFVRYFKDARKFGHAVVRQLWYLRWRLPARAPSAAPATVMMIEPTWRRLRPPEALCREQVERDASVWSETLGHHCLIELGHVRFIDSTGVGLLIDLHRQLLSRECSLVLLDPSDPVKRALQLMRLDHFFLVAGDVLEARDLIDGRIRQRRRIPALSAHATLPLIWQGEITAANAEEIWTMAQSQIDSFEDLLEPITIDLSGVPFIDSTGVSLLLRVRRYATEHGATLYFVNPSPAVRNVLGVSRLEKVLLGVNGSTIQRFNGSTLSRLMRRGL